ncbi:uncharacterized protein PV09_06999 [Verruconis gallopava]|uniref:Ribosomal protein S8 n=1 Tax=Verruconis gallopava TaxID=253628 RepID=A0A0D1XH51_9PEZI|nr:uncharacterized protein PV09_06999 [Verruconis gallopava]KIW01521.1 hypothetical protein PV09_06999 [Verruconis gallopava]
MVFSNLSNVCSHLQNASRARLSLTSIPMTKMHLALCLALQKQGLISTLQVAGRKPPTAELGEDITLESRESLENELAEQPWLGMDYQAASNDGVATAGLSLPPDEVLRSQARSKTLSASVYKSVGVPVNPAHRRIWLGLKYWDNEPVLRSVQMISKPKRKITAKVEELRRLVAGKKAGIIQPLVNPGECMFVSTDIGILEAREAIERKRGGLLLVRTG